MGHKTKAPTQELPHRQRKKPGCLLRSALSPHRQALLVLPLALQWMEEGGVFVQGGAVGVLVRVRPGRMDLGCGDGAGGWAVSLLPHEVVPNGGVV
jgi:hypothetical protein